jgi:hypothetical protein
MNPSGEKLLLHVKNLYSINVWNFKVKFSRITLQVHMYYLMRDTKVLLLYGKSQNSEVIEVFRNV